MDLIKFSVDVIGGIVGGTTNVFGLVIGSALDAMGVSPEIANTGINVANSIIETSPAGQAGSVVGGVAGSIMTAYVALKVMLWGTFKFCPEKFLLNTLDWLAFRIARKSKLEVIQRVKEKDAQLHIKEFAKKALSVVNEAIERGIN